MRAALSRRPHVGSSQFKYQYDVVVHSLQLLTAAPNNGTISVLWTRGSKTAITSEQRFTAAEVADSSSPSGVFVYVWHTLGLEAKRSR